VRAAAATGIGGQVWIQFQGVLVAIVLSASWPWWRCKIVDLIVGLRVTEDEEREGLDVS
jgi:Amt family ammonium transporter